MPAQGTAIPSESVRILRIFGLDPYSFPFMDFGVITFRLKRLSGDGTFWRAGAYLNTSGRDQRAPREAWKMICANCGRDIADYSNFCCFCGMRQHVSPGGPPRAAKRLRRSVTDRKIAGVCGGIAEYFEVDSTIVRLIWVLLILLPIPLVPAFIGYFAAWLILPKGPMPAASAEPPIIIPNSTQSA